MGTYRWLAGAHSSDRAGPTFGGGVPRAAAKQRASEAPVPLGVCYERVVFHTQSSEAPRSIQTVWVWCVM